MKVQVKYDESHISLIHEKSHFTLYRNDLINLWENGSKEFNYRVEDYLYDVLPDEGYRDWEWDSKALKEACYYVHKHLKK